MKNCKIDILGTEYTIVKIKYDEDSVFSKESIDGYCSSQRSEIVYCDMTTHPNTKGGTKEEIRNIEGEILRHEIVHAFLSESGLAESTTIIDRAWAKNEEMIDWFAIQSPKMFKAFQAVGAL